MITIIASGLNLHSVEFQTIKVKPGQTLWEISQKYLKNPQKWDEILKYNNLPQNPYIPLTGRTIKVPVTLIKEELRAAHFVKVINDVKVRPKNKSVWEDANNVTELYKGDTVRTNTDSYADIRFYTGQILNLFANSMVVLKPPKQETDLRLLSGQIKTKDTTVITVSARITPKKKNTEFAAKINPDLSTVVQVYKGLAEVEAKGKKVLVSEGLSTEVKFNKAPELPKKIPDILLAQNIPNINVKIEKNTINLGTPKVKNLKAPKITEQTKPKELKLESNIQIDLKKAISGYRLQVAKDINFKEIVFDKKFDVFTKINLSEYLPKGKYYFRISYIDLIGFEIGFSEPKEIEVK